MSTADSHCVLLPLQEATCRSQGPPSKEARLCPGWVQAPMAGAPASRVDHRVALAFPRGQVSPTGCSAHNATLQHEVSCLSLWLICAMPSPKQASSGQPITYLPWISSIHAREG